MAWRSMLQASSIVVTNEGQRSRGSDHEASVRHSFTLLHAIQYAASDQESFRVGANVRSSEGMRLVSWYDTAHRIAEACNWISRSGYTGVIMITVRTAATILADIGSPTLVILSRVARSTFPGGP
jgi:hypothetical protein